MAFLLGAVNGGTSGIAPVLSQDKRPKIITAVGSQGGNASPTDGQIYPTGR